MQQPLSLTNIVGGAANFSCIVTGTAPINLQWTFLGNPLPGATNSILSVTNLQPNNIGYYALTATNIFGGTISFNAALKLAGYNFALSIGLVAYYPFNGNANDASGNGNNGTNISSFYSSDRFFQTNSSLVVTGQFSEVRAAGSPSLDVYSTFTISAWLFVTNDWNDDYKVFIAKSGNGSFQGVQFLFRLDTSKHYVLWIGDGSSSFTEFPSSATYALGGWHHALATFDSSSGGVAIYVDGKLDSTFVTSQECFSAPDFPLHVGNDFVTSQSFNGQIDDVRIYNRALSSNEVALLYALESQATVVPPLMLTATLRAGTNFNLNLTGISGQNYVLQTTTNLTPPIQWLPVLTNAADTNGVWQFTDTNLDSPQKFYRVTTP
jgi:hypothetical protein